ncbi:MAG: succinate dehydrogenase iron-sulfur subunit [bacterium]|nr:succinate dehydrogenase iron-sulfur subunit [bacterium]
MFILVMITFKIFRYDPTKDKTPHFDSFEVNTKPGMTVLEGLYFIREYRDGSLAFRSSCRAAVCGSCAMHINGQYRLACETQIAALKAQTVTIRPLAHLRVLKDLIVDMEPFWQKLHLIKPYLMPGTPAPVQERPQTPQDQEKLMGIIDCILCGSCYSSCTVTLTDPNYIGPAAFLKANRFLIDSRDNAVSERLRLVDGEHGVWRCHTIFNCQKVCPKDCDPTGSIANLKRHLIAKKTGITMT